MVYSSYLECSFMKCIIYINVQYEWRYSKKIEIQIFNLFHCYVNVNINCEQFDIQ